MGFKLKGKPYDEDNMNIAVYRKNLDDGSAAKSNHTGIILQTGLSPEVEGAAIEHEKVHQRQQKRGDLDYDENNFYWKGKTYSRKNLNEHNAKLPWEVEAYKESNKILNGKQTNKQMKEKFQLRNGKGNGASFANLTSKGLMGASLDTDPIKPSIVATTGSREAKEQKANLAKIGVEKQVKLRSDEFGDFGSGEDVGVKKYTSFYKASTPALKEKGNAFWSSLSEPQKQEIRDKKSRYEMSLEMKPKPIVPVETSSSRKIQRVPLKTPPEIPSREKIKTRKEIKRESLSQYPGTARMRYGVGKSRFGTRKTSQLLTNVFGMKNVKSASSEKHYKEQLALRREKKHANRKANKFLDLGQATKNFRDVFNKPNNTKVTTKTFTKKVKLGKKNKIT